MDKFIKKLIERLEAEKEENPCRKTLCKECKYTNNCYEGEQSGKVAIDNAIEIVNELAEEFATDINVVSNNGWIPCSERLPENIIKDCLVTLENGAVFQASYSDIGKEFRMICWHGIERFSEENKVIAWMPLPEPYKQGKQV